MITGLESITIFSANAASLAKFYEEKVGLKIGMTAEMGEDNSNLFEIKAGAGSSFYIVDHSDLHGPAKEPKRFIMNFEVDNIEKEVARLKKAKVKLIQDIYHVEDYGHIATFSDLDGNFFQLVQTHSN